MVAVALGVTGSGVEVEGSCVWVAVEVGRGVSVGAGRVAAEQETIREDKASHKSNFRIMRFGPLTGNLSCDLVRMYQLALFDYKLHRDWLVIECPRSKTKFGRQGAVVRALAD